MCSIAGGKNLKEEEVQAMLDIMKHRAPDGFSVYADDRFGIGMGRLKIIDLTSPGLCLYKERGHYLAFNGEVYNYKDLRKELTELGHAFTTTSDIEVVLKSYLQWGVDCFEKFNGMFALAIYDGFRVVLARDIAGQKPLYYRLKDFRFASEAKALDFDCFELPPAHYATYDTSSDVFQVKPYWTLQPRDIDWRTMDEELEYLIGDAVRLCTQSDVPYGLYYSGGVDSSLIKTYHNFEHVFTYRDADYSQEFKSIFPKILWHLDAPIESFSPFGLWKLAEQASQAGVKVVLSGEGADELFGGYIRYVLPHFNFMAKKKFPSYKSMFEPAIDVHTNGLKEFNGNMRELLRMGDRMASAFGIENRCPFLDKRLIEFAYSLPYGAKISGLKTKVILQKILSKRNPKYKKIEKRGLYVSVNEWLGNSTDKFGKKTYLDYQHELWKGIKHED